MVRSQVNFKRLSLTDIKIDIKRVPKKKDLVKAMEDVVSLLFYWLLLLLILSLGYNWKYLFMLLVNEQVGEEFMGKKTLCQEEKGIPQWLWLVQDKDVLRINLYPHDSSHHVINFNFNNKVLFYFHCHISLFDEMVHLIMSLIKIKDLLL